MSTIRKIDINNHSLTLYVVRCVECTYRCPSSATVQPFSHGRSHTVTLSEAASRTCRRELCTVIQSPDNIQLCIAERVV